MAKPRRRQEYTPALIENLRFRFEETDESVLDIAASIARSHTTLRKRAREWGWTKFAPPPLDLSPAAKLAAEAGRSALSSRATACHAGGPGPIRRSDHEAPGPMGPRLRGDDTEESGRTPHDTAASSTPTRTASPSDLPLAGGGEEEADAEPTRGGDKETDLSNLAPDARMARLSQMARALDFQLAHLRQKQAYPQRGEDNKAINAEVKHFAATSALIEHQLSELQNGRTTPLPNETNDDIPEDIDAFRLRLAAKIEAFLDRRPDIGDGDADAGEGRGPARP